MLHYAGALSRGCNYFTRAGRYKSLTPVTLVLLNSVCGTNAAGLEEAAPVLC